MCMMHFSILQLQRWSSRPIAGFWIIIGSEFLEFFILFDSYCAYFVWRISHKINVTA